MNEVAAKCPKKKCPGYAIVPVSHDEGNVEGECETCDSLVGFHYVIEVDGICLLQDEE